MNQDISAWAENIVSKTIMVEDCVIYDPEGELQEISVDWDRILKFYGDKTGYEVACNEIRLGEDTWDKSKIMIRLGEFGKLLSSKYGKNMCLYAIKTDYGIWLRFHTFRENEASWLGKDPDQYDQPIIKYVTNLSAD